MTVTVGLLHPGQMGAQVGRCLVDRGTRVVWVSDGRSAATAERAAQAGIEDVGSVRSLVAVSDVILSVCPPHAAAQVAAAVGEFTGIYVEANAVSPTTARRIGDSLSTAGYVDGGIVGPPPVEAGTTRLYVAGEHSDIVAELFDATPLEVIVIPGGIGAASALKMTYAAWTKGSAALLLAIRSAARSAHVESALLAEWDRSQPGLGARSDAAAESARSKGWRWIGEMEQIAEMFHQAGVPDGFFGAAAEVYRRGGLDQLDNGPDGPGVGGGH